MQKRERNIHFDDITSWHPSRNINSVRKLEAVNLKCSSKSFKACLINASRLLKCKDMGVCFRCTSDSGVFLCRGMSCEFTNDLKIKGDI